MTKRVWLLVLAVVLMVASERQMDALRPPTEQGGAAYVQMLGEFRVVAANLLWVKADEYNHEYEARHATPLENRELIGMCQLITQLNPRFEQAYLVGSMIYRKGDKDPRKAKDYLLLGYKYLPSSWEIPRDLALLEGIDYKDKRAALPYARMAYKNATDPFYKANMLRLVKAIEQHMK